MYLGLAILMGAVFLRLKTNQTDIQPFINVIFFGSAFMSFMAIAYVPAFLEDRATFVKERANGLCGPLAFTIANFLIGLPYLFFIAILFSVVEYFLSNFLPTFSAFMMWVMWLFLDLVAAESLIVLVSSIFPVFVVALAVAAFANGLWMCVDGFLVPMATLNVFWKYVFHYIDYQAYVFQGMLVNELQSRVFDCAGNAQTGYQCMYPSDLAPAGKVRGTAILEAFNYHTGLESE
jgi:ABC-type multidrug transport system permease subunit